MRLSSLFTAVAALTASSAVVEGASYTNPLKDPNGSDPFMVYLDDGYYYLTTTTWTDIQITRATTLEGLKTGENKVVWVDSDASRCCNVWAPEFFFLDGTWYLYYTAGTDGTFDYQVSHVLQGGASLWDDEFTYLNTLTTEWGIDGTILFVGDTTYYVWSCMTSGGQSLCIATLDAPGTLGATHILSEPDQEWEQAGTPVEEGPAALYHGGTTYVAFSASSCATASYQLGYLTWDGAGDPLERNSWSKTGPVFSSANGNYGTAHNGFFTSPDGSEIWNIYHATSNAEGICDGSRYTMAQPVNWNEDGTPAFGEAPALDTVLEGPPGEPA